MYVVILAIICCVWELIIEGEYDVTLLVLCLRCTQWYIYFLQNDNPFYPFSLPSPYFLLADVHHLHHIWLVHISRICHSPVPNHKKTICGHISAWSFSSQPWWIIPPGYILRTPNKDICPLSSASQAYRRWDDSQSLNT